MNILLLKGYPDIDRERIESYMDHTKHTLYELGDDYNPNDIDTVIVPGNYQVDAKLFDMLPNLKRAWRSGVGMNNFNREEANKRGIEIVNRPGSNANSVADLCIRGILSMLRKTNIVQQYVEHKEIPARGAICGKEMSAMNIGLLGFGNIGKKIAQRLQGFQPKSISFFDPFVEKGVYGAEKKETSDEILHTSDIIIIALPLLPTTKDFFDSKTLALCHKDVTLINIARGGIINEEDLYQFLLNNKQASYYTDVRKGEPQYTEQLQRLIKLPNYLMTPHIAAKTQQAQDRMHYFEDLI